MQMNFTRFILHSIGRYIVVGGLRQSSASLHPPFGTSFLREPLTRPRPATLCQSPPTTTLPVLVNQKITVTADVPLKAYNGVSYGRFGVFARTVHIFSTYLLITKQLRQSAMDGDFRVRNILLSPQNEGCLWIKYATQPGLPLNHLLSQPL